MRKARAPQAFVQFFVNEQVNLCSNELHRWIVLVAQDKLKEQGGIYSKVGRVLRPLSIVCIALMACLN